MRSPRPDNGPLVSSQDAPGDNAATQVVLAFDDNRLASVLFGQYGQNLALIERRLGVVAEQRGNHVNVAGSRDGVERALQEGDIVIADQRGDLVASLDEEEGVITHAFDLDFLDRYRAAWGFFRDRRPEFYR